MRFLTNAWVYCDQACTIRNTNELLGLILEVRGQGNGVIMHKKALCTEFCVQYRAFCVSHILVLILEYTVPGM